MRRWTILLVALVPWAPAPDAQAKRLRTELHASTYFHRAPGGRIAFGPLWDFDIAMGNTTLDRFRTPPGWHLGQRPYAERLYRDRRFVRAMARRWRELPRAGLRREMLGAIARD
ncbi:MAG: hypothetical protein ACRDLD_14745, partial [Thermoleophilaceae bacterium]